MNNEFQNRMIEMGGAPDSYPSPILAPAKVMSVDDATGARRIKARIKGVDDRSADADLPYAAPMIPLTIPMDVRPGEMVWVMIPDSKLYNANRMWFGPNIPQYGNINNSPADNAAMNAFSSGIEQLQPDTNTVPGAEGNFPTKDQSGLVGRKNADLLFGENTATMRAGQYIPDKPLEASENPALVKLTRVKEQSSSLTQADYNFTISHEGDGNVPKDALSMEFERLLELTSPMVKGTPLADLLRLVINAILYHVHPYSNMPADKSGYVQKLSEFNVDDIKSENNRLN